MPASSRWAGVARVVRSQTLALKEKEFIEAARANGTTQSTVMAHHIFPNVVPTLIVLFSLSIPDAIMWESSLSFLGVGVQPPASSWGLLVSTGKDYLFQVVFRLGTSRSLTNTSARGNEQAEANEAEHSTAERMNNSAAAAKCCQYGDKADDCD